jgi:D-glycero-D-manno-heptose 1,7-bisphosphate phosphatase
MPEVGRWAVFLDRDGVINCAVVRGGKPYPPASLQEFEFLPGVQKAVAALRTAGFVLVVTTNQPDVKHGRPAARGRRGYAQPCPRGPRCRRRKSVLSCRRGRLHLPQAAAERDIDLRRSFMVGDRWHDIGAGRAAGCTTVLVESNYDEQQADKPDLVVSSLREAAESIIETYKE